jgi:hypothetical protein
MIETVKDIGVQSLGVYLIDMTPVPEIINSDSSFLTRNLKRGLTYYLLEEAIEQVNNGTSNLSQMDGLKLVDDTIYYGLASSVIEATKAPNVLSRLIPNGYVTEDIKSAIITGTLLEGVKYVGSKINTNDQFGFIRHASEKIKSLFNF